MEEETLDLKLRVAADPNGSYEITISLIGVGIYVQTHDTNLRAGILAAAAQCAEELDNQGFVVTVDQILNALETALENLMVTTPPANKDMN